MYHAVPRGGSRIAVSISGLAVGDRSPGVGNHQPGSGDRGTAVSDRRTPISDRGTPVSDRGTPVSDRRTPVNDRSSGVRGSVRRCARRRAGDGASSAASGRLQLDVGNHRGAAFDSGPAAGDRRRPLGHRAPAGRVRRRRCVEQPSRAISATGPASRPARALSIAAASSSMISQRTPRARRSPVGSSEPTSVAAKLSRTASGS